MVPSTLTREGIIDWIVETMSPEDYVLAIWEGGSAAFDRLDEHSDLDLYILVSIDHSNEAQELFERSMKRLSGIELKYSPPTVPWPGVVHAFYRLMDAPELLLLDLAIIEEGSPESFLEIETHGNAKLHYDGIHIRPPHIDQEGLSRTIRSRMNDLIQKFELFKPFLEKDLIRGNVIDALDTYRKIFLDVLVEFLRIRYSPARYCFGAHGLKHEVPEELMTTIEPLFFISDLDDLRNKSSLARDMIYALRAEIDEMGIETLVKG